MKTIKSKIIYACWLFVKGLLFIYLSLWVLSFLWQGVLVLKSYIN